MPHALLPAGADGTVETGTPLENPRPAYGPYGGCGICYNCHGAGVYNTWQDSRFINCGECRQ